ncbi:MAG: hemerythrin domain-containing protein [Bacteroides sp.]|nr:hemerythrin domain-containing protein [Bacteroides sp.]
MEQTHKTYQPDDRMITLINDNFQLLQVMSRFGIKVGFGDLTVREVCVENGVDCHTFLTVVNCVNQGFSPAGMRGTVSLPALVDYLRRSHHYFLDYFLPAIRRKLTDGIEQRTSDVSFLILKFFDEYTAEVRQHMNYEEQMLFGYIDSLTRDGVAAPPQGMRTYSDHHEEVSERLGELKNIILKYCPVNADVDLLNDALYDIYRCEVELESHCRLEDTLLVPAIMNLERLKRTSIREEA